MSPDFITHVIDGSPQVLIITAQSSLATPLSNALQELKFEVVVVSHEELKHEQLSNAYKLVWLQTTFESIPLQTLSPILAPHQTKLWLVQTGFTPINPAGPVAEKWSQASYQQHQWLAQLAQWFEEAAIIFGQDVLIPPLINFVPFGTIIQQIAQPQLIDPGVSLYPHSWSSFCQAAARLILTPNRDVFVIQGKKVASSSVVKLLELHHQRLTQQLVKISPVELTATSLPFTNLQPLPSATILDLDHTIRELAQEIPSPVVEAPPSVPQPIAPTPSVSSRPYPSVPKLNLKTRVTQLTPVQTSVIQAQPALAAKPLQVVSTSVVILKPTQPTIPQEELEAEVTRLFQGYRSEQKVERVKNIAKKSVKTTKKVAHKQKVFIGGLVFVSLGLFVASLAAFFFISSWQLQQSVLSALAKPQPQPNRTTSLWSSLVAGQAMAYSQVFDSSLFSSTLSVAELAASLSTVQEHINKLDSLAEKGVLQALGRKDGDSTTTIKEANLVAQSLYEVLSQNQAKLKDLSGQDITPDQVEALARYETALIQQKKSLLPIQQLESILPSLLAKNAKRTYAVLLQNNQELRATGGFIQAVALITFDRGLLINTQVFSVYELDSQATGLVEPPVEITQLLGERQWFLRDSNWHPDFPTSATTIKGFVERSTGKTVDGVIGLNLLVIQDLLKSLGPVELPEYNEVLTDRNLAERMEFHSEVQLAPTNDQPDYSALFLQRLLQKISQVQSDKIPQLLTTLNRSFDQKQLLLSLDEPSELATVGALGWTGSLLEPSCPTQLSDVPCFVDVVAQVETNVGINKANAYITRSMSDIIDVSPTQAKHQRQIILTNKATSNSWPKGTYKNYIRLYVPATAELQQVTIDGTPLSAMQAVVKSDQNRRVFSFLVEVPIKKTVTVEVVYTVPLTTSGSFAYGLFNQQQPGTEPTPFKTTIRHSSDLKPSLIAPQAKVVNQTIEFEPLSSTHSLFGVKF